MFKKPSRKQFIIRRVILSSVATLSVIIIVTATILFMLGYRLDGGNGRLEQGALLQFDSVPGGATVAVDGNVVGRTANKHTTLAGIHTVTMTRDGYQSWNRTLDLPAGTLTWLNYIRLVPVDRPVQQVATYQSLAGLELSPAGRFALALPDASVPAMQLVNLQSEEVRTSGLVLPAATYSEAATEGVTHAFSIESWDEGGRYVLMKHLYNDASEWLVVDTQNVERTVNITQLLSVGLKDLKFSGTNGTSFYGLTDDGAVRKIDLSAATISRAFVSHVDSFSLYDNTVVSYVGTDTSNANAKVVGVYRDGDDAPHILHTAESPDTTLMIAVGRYFSDNYVAIAENDAVTILKGSYPSSSSQDNSSLAEFAQFTLNGTVSALSFSSSSDYVVAQSGASFKSYEIEHERVGMGAIATKDGAPAHTLRWLDAAHLWGDDNNTLIMRDFNGINIYSIMTVAPGYDAGLSQSGRFLYAVGQDEQGFHLQRVRMILN